MLRILRGYCGGGVLCTVMAQVRQEILQLCEEKSSQLFWSKMRNIYIRIISLHYNEFIHESIFPLQYCGDISLITLLFNKIISLNNCPRRPLYSFSVPFQSSFSLPVASTAHEKRYSSTIVVTSTKKNITEQYSTHKSDTRSYFTFYMRYF
jgi:hypothetical protein